ARGGWAPGGKRAPSGRSCTSRRTRKEVGTSEDLEDGQAGASGPVSDQDLVTPARPGPARAGPGPPGRRRMERPRIKRTLELVASARGDVYILRPTEDADLRVELPDETARALFDALDGTRTVP